jgi:PAS domain S-box-containing protein
MLNRYEIRKSHRPKVSRRHTKIGHRIHALQHQCKEEALHGQEDIFRDLAEKSLAGIYIIQDGVFKYSNPAFADMFDYNVEEMIEKMGPKDMVLPEDWPLVDENIRKRVSGPRGLWFPHRLSSGPSGSHRNHAGHHQAKARGRVVEEG